MPLLMKILSAPITWVLILVLVITMQCKQLEKVNDSLEVSQQQISQLNDNIKIVKSDQETMSELLKKKMTITAKQTEIRTEIQSIPDTSADRPFENENTLQAAEKFREYQENALKEN